MLPQSSIKTIRDAQRARSLAINAQSRLHASSQGQSRPSRRNEPQQQGSRATRQNSRKASMSRVSVEDALVDADEEREARARAEVLEQDDAVARKCSAVEVPLHELVVTSKIGRESEFEVVRPVKGVIALGDDDFGQVERQPGASSSSSEEDDSLGEWELLDVEEAVRKEGPAPSRTWASIVTRA